MKLPCSPVYSIAVCAFVVMSLVSCGDPPTAHQTRSAKPKSLQMRLIPKDTFLMGGRSAQAYDNELPQRPVIVEAFYMDAYEVTNAEFKNFVEATGYVTDAEQPVDKQELMAQMPPGTTLPPDIGLDPGSLVFKATSQPVDLRDFSQWWEWRKLASWYRPAGEGSAVEGLDNHPVVHLSHDDAKAFCAWKGKRLPTEAEWESAASSGKTYIYPWGNEPIEEAYDKANFWQGLFPYQNTEKDGYIGTAPVGSYPPNAYGLYDMAGNVWEWCADKFASDHYRSLDSDTLTNPVGPGRSKDYSDPYNQHSYVIRGGSFLCNDEYCSGYRISRRLGKDAKSSSNHTGCRCAKDRSR